VLGAHGPKQKSLLLIFVLAVLLFQGTAPAGQSGQTNEKSAPQSPASEKIEINGMIQSVNKAAKSISIEPPDKRKNGWKTLSEYPQGGGRSWSIGKNALTDKTFLTVHPSTTIPIVNQEGKVLDLSNLSEGDPVTVILAPTPSGGLVVVRIVAQIACKADFCAVGKCHRKCGAKVCECSK
jgi:hypothetical protein